MPGIAYEFIKRYNDRFIYLTIQYTSKSYWMFTSSNKVQLSVEPISELENKKKICSWITELNPEDNSIRIQDMAHIVRSISKCSVNDEIVSECLEKLQIGDGYKEFISLCKVKIKNLRLDEMRQKEEEQKKKEMEEKIREKIREREEKIREREEKRKEIEAKKKDKILRRKIKHLIAKGFISDITRIHDMASEKRTEIHRKYIKENRDYKNKLYELKGAVFDPKGAVSHDEERELYEINEWEINESCKILTEIEQTGVVKTTLNERVFKMTIEEFNDLDQLCSYIEKPELGRLFESPKSTFDHIKILVGLSQVITDDEVRNRVKKYSYQISGWVIESIKNDKNYGKYNVPINYLKIDNIIFDKKARVLHYWLSLKIIE